MSVDKITMDGEYETVDGRPVLVLCVDRPNKDYPVVCLVGTSADVDLYTADGYYHADKRAHPGNLRKLSPWRDFQLDELVFARNMEGQRWERAHFAGAREGEALTWQFGMTSQTVQGLEDYLVSWKQCRRPTEDELQAYAKHKAAFQAWLES